MQNWIRIILSLSGLLLIVVLFVPMWRIDLDAPQYPEGLRLLIYPHTLGGNVNIINGLNHYIGMKTLQKDDFVEFAILPYIIMFFAAFFVAVGIIGNRKLMYILCFLFVCFGIIAMVDFWRWEYNYGHNLNPEAAIIVPGMAYQPPLIGFKQLLNFGAYSVPDVGGWIFLEAGAVLLFSSLADFFKFRKFKKNNMLTMTPVLFFVLLFISACSSAPQQIKIGIDNCQFCKMTISDIKYGAEAITNKGKVFKFDDINCLLIYIKEGNLKKADIKDVYFTDFCSSHQLFIQSNIFLLKSDELKSPMGGNIAAYSSNDSLKLYTEKLKGQAVTWDQLIN